MQSPLLAMTRTTAHNGQDSLLESVATLKVDELPSSVTTDNKQVVERRYRRRQRNGMGEERDGDGMVGG